ncbi:helix-turn-helix domain-containing protein [Legionella sp. CNM-4043-24]|uniref:helix-turn-helix domain-containing protein n=1 Tax=Legionella sp. CNM-4043-24 TaxID=3421646 RepID=UPI00403B1C95
MSSSTTQGISNVGYTHSTKTLNILGAAQLLGAHKETIRRMAVSGALPSVKIGRGWRFIEQDLVLYMRSRYSDRVTSQGAVTRSEKQWRFTKETRFGGSASPIMDKEYNEALGLPTR